MSWKISNNFYNTVRIIFIVIFRIVKNTILFRLFPKVLNLDYGKKHNFRNSFLIIQFKIKNVLFLRINNGRLMVSNQFVIVDLNSLTDSQLKLTVRGIFKKLVIPIELGSLKILNSSSFETNFVTSFNRKTFTQFHLESSIKTHLRNKGIGIKKHNLGIRRQNIKIIKQANTKIFNQ